MTAPFRRTYHEASAIDVIEQVEHSWKLKLSKQPPTSTIQSLLSFGIFHPNHATLLPKEEDALHFTKKRN